MKERTLYELFMDAYFEMCFIPWRIYGESNKLICKNYCDVTSDTFDNMIVRSYSLSKNKDFVRVYVKKAWYFDL